MRCARALLILVGVALPCAAADDMVGCVKTATGSAVVLRAGQSIPATDGMHLLLHDILRTAADGRLGAILQDGTGIGLGPSTELNIDTFLYDPSNGKMGVVLRLVQGVFAYFSGRIAKLSPGSVTVETPVGVIGLRGTHMAVSIGGAQ